MTAMLAPPATAPGEAWTLVERAQRGDAEAFGLIYDRYRERLWRFVYYRVSSQQVAEDIVADTFLRALASINTVQWRGKDLGAWLTTIARNLVTDYHKSGAYRMSVSVPAVYECTTMHIEPAPDTADLVADAALAAIVRDAVSYLTDDQRQVIELRFFQGLSVIETAAVMGKNEGAVKAVQYRAVCALRRLLDKAEVR